MHKTQPKGLYLLFLTELWERFGFYTLQTILILYMAKALLLTDSDAYLQYGAFSSLIYFTPVIGGYLADKFLGFQRSILIGGCLFVLGYFLMGFPFPHSFYIGLSLVIIANGFFKPCVSSIVGDLYHKDDPRRDGGFTIFYMGINLGALLPPLITGSLAADYGWKWVFFLAAGGMFIGLVTFLSARQRLKGAGEIPPTSSIGEDVKKRIKFYLFMAGGIIASIIIIQLLLVFPKETVIFLVIGSLLAIMRMVFYLVKEEGLVRRRMIACLILILISMGFWAIYTQKYTVLMLFADRNMHKEFLGITIDAEFTRFFNPFFIIILSPFFSRLWSRLGNLGHRNTIPSKFTTAVFFMALAYFVLGCGIKYFNVDGEASIWWLVLSYLLQTIGELLISPVGLSMVTTLAPKSLTGMMMGVWFLTQSAAFAIGGGLSTFASVSEGTTKEISIYVYSEAFIVYGLISLIVTLFSLAMIPFLKDLIKDKDATKAT